MTGSSGRDKSVVSLLGVEREEDATSDYSIVFIYSGKPG